MLILLTLIGGFTCGDSYTETIPATGHVDSVGDGICDNCGELLEGNLLANK